MLLRTKDFNRAGILTVHWIRQMPFSLFILFVLSSASNQYFEWLGRILNESEQGPWPAQVGEFLISSIEGMALFLIGGLFLINQQMKIGWGEYLKKYTGPLTAESFRALTRILLWSLAFILPGLVMYCRMMFVPFVIFFDPSYATHPDAVARAKELTKKHWLQVTVLTFVLSCVDGVFELIPNLLKIDDLVFRTCVDFCGFVFSLFSFILLYMIFENLMRTQEKGS